MFPPPPFPAELELEARTRLTIAQANEREIIAAQKAGALVSIATVNAWFAGQVIRARDMLLRWPGELAERIAAEQDPVKCEQMMIAEQRRALDVLKLMGRDGVLEEVAPEQEHNA
jgi:hypothetical protein